MSRRSALYITYDGLLDPLGGSQILPYIEAVAPDMAAMWILSFEKRERLDGASALKKRLTRQGIRWFPLRFTRGGGALGKVWDLIRMQAMVLALTLAGRIKLLHARGHPAAQATGWARKLSGARLLFDMRGLWADERVDKGGWDLTRPWHLRQYRHYKKIEQHLLEDCDHLVVLSEKVVPEVLRLGMPDPACITVIPCCADFDHFPLATQQARDAARQALDLPGDALVLGYLGSIGKMYRLDDVLRLGILALTQYPSARLFCLTPDGDQLDKLVNRLVPEALRDRIRWRGASRGDIPALLAGMDIMVSFIAPSYARIASSPTKLAEGFATGLPAICNHGTGDVGEIMTRIDGGTMIDPDDGAAMTRLVADLPSLARRGGMRLRTAARPLLGLEIAAERYRAIYARLTA